MKVNVQSLLPMRGDHDRRNEPIRHFSKRLMKLSEEYGYDFIGLHVLVGEGRGQLKAGFTPDWLHLNEGAYGVWQEQILNTMLWR